VSNDTRTRNATHGRLKRTARVIRASIQFKRVYRVNALINQRYSFRDCGVDCGNATVRQLMLHRRFAIQRRCNVRNAHFVLRFSGDHYASEPGLHRNLSALIA
jgi:hypothetical protein